MDWIYLLNECISCGLIAFRPQAWKLLGGLRTQMWLTGELESLRAGACRIIAFRLQGWKMLEELRTQLWLKQKLEDWSLQNHSIQAPGLEDVGGAKEPAVAATEA